MSAPEGALALASVPMMADMVGRHADYRVLRRMRPMLRGGVMPRGEGAFAGCALDVETTGLDHGRDRVVELALQRFWADRDGLIRLVGRPWAWLEDPGRPLSPEVARLTGLTDADLRGRSIIDAEATSILQDVDVIVAHNAAFDRPFVEARLPGMAGNRWICTVRDVDWRAWGLEGRALSHLLLQVGWFYDAHRASTDVTALLHLLDHRAGDGGSVLGEALATAGRPTWVMEAVDAPFEAREPLRRRGYRWDAGARHWSREVRLDRFDEEYEWLVVHAYRGRGRPRFRQVTWRERYSARRIERIG